MAAHNAKLYGVNLEVRASANGSRTRAIFLCEKLGCMCVLRTETVPLHVHEGICCCKFTSHHGGSCVHLSCYSAGLLLPSKV